MSTTLASSYKPRIRVLPYRKGSKSAKALAEALGGKVLRLEGSTFSPRKRDLIINWGNGSPPGPPNCYNTFNWKGLAQVTDKLKFFNKMKAECPEIIPNFYTEKEDIPDDKFPIVCRTILSGHSGAGIVVANNRDDLVDAPLYVEYKKKKDEYRVHVGTISDKNGYPYSEGGPYTEVIAVQRKARRTDCENPNWQIRNHSNGFVFVRNNVSPPALVLEAARKAFEASSLDFGAVDVIWNEHEGKAYVLEINTAPGLEGQTVTDYANFFKGV